MTSKLTLNAVEKDNFDITFDNKSTISSNKIYTPGDYEDIAISMKQMFKESKIDVR